MKKSDWVLAAVVILLIFTLFILFWGKQNRGSQVLIQVDGVEYGRYDLRTEQVIEIGESNRLKIKGGEAFMTHADCPDQLCVKMDPVSQIHELIVCMPNKVIVEVVAE